MNAVQLALTIAGITALAGLTQASVQGILASRATRVAARQAAVQAEITLLLRLQEQLVDMGQACNDYGLEMFGRGFYSDQKWAEVRRPLLQRLLSCQGRVIGTAHSLPPTSRARVAAITATDVAMNLALQETVGGDPKKINENWTRDSSKILAAIEVAGASVRQEYIRLQDVTRNGIARALRRAGRALGRKRANPPAVRSES